MYRFATHLPAGAERFGSIPNPFHVLQEHLLTAAIIKLRGPAVGVARRSAERLQGYL